MTLIILSVVCLSVNAYATEPFKDSFIDLNNWNIGRGSPTVSNNILSLSNARITSKTSYSMSIFDMEFDMKYIGQGYYDNGYSGLWASDSNYPRIEWTSPAARNSNANFYVFTAGSGGNYAGVTNYWDGNWHHVRYVHNASGATVYIDGIYQLNRGGVPSGSGVIRLDFTTSVQIKNFYFDTTDSGQVFTSNTNFNGYVKDENGNPIQYTNVSLWKNDGFESALRIEEREGDVA
jgi:hypothetical protein